MKYRTINSAWQWLLFFSDKRLEIKTSAEILYCTIYVFQTAKGLKFENRLVIVFWGIKIIEMFKRLTFSPEFKVVRIKYIFQSYLNKLILLNVTFTSLPFILNFQIIKLSGIMILHGA